MLVCLLDSPHISEVVVHEVEPVALYEPVRLAGLLPADGDGGVADGVGRDVEGGAGHALVRHDDHRGGGANTLGVHHLEADQVLGEHAQVLDGELRDGGALDGEPGGVLAGQVPLPVGELVAQELPVQGGGVGRGPGQVDGLAGRVVGRSDGRLPAGLLPQGDHVVALLALLAQAHPVHGHHLEAVDTEGVEAGHTVHRLVVSGAHRAGGRPVSLLPSPHLQGRREITGLLGTTH